MDLVWILPSAVRVMMTTPGPAAGRGRTRQRERLSARGSDANVITDARGGPAGGPDEVTG